MEDWKNEAKRVSVYDAFQKLRAPTVLKKTSEGFAGPCPKCGGNDRFSINKKDNVFNCRGCGAKGGDGIGVIMQIDGEPFLAAVEILAGRPRPDGKETNQKPRDEEAMRERAEERRVSAAVEENAELKKKRQERQKLQAFFEGCAPFKNSMAQQYLKNRKIALTSEQQTDLRCAPELAYYGFAHEDAEALSDLGRYPAMVAAIRDFAGELVGLHYTYLDPETLLKLRPPGDQDRNKAKKVRGTQQGGHIRLGPYSKVMALGEGIETTASWYQMGVGPEEAGIICGVNLGNIAAKCTGSIPHPQYKKRPIPNGEPLPEAEQNSIVLPSEIETVILLVDGDSDPASTMAKILSAGRRFRALGKAVQVCHPNIKGDFNDLLMEGD